MQELSQRLLYYKRKEIESRIVDSCKTREVGIRYGDNGYGKRPDILVYDNDVLDSVKKGATSFHISEERWSNPMNLTTEMRKQDLDDLRIGWDLLLDIDCPYWFYSKLTTHLFIKALKMHGINSISCKFSGNKGFHIGVPFETFPKELNGLPVKNWFPEGPKKIALYLVDYITKNLITIDESGKIIFDKMYEKTIEMISEETGKPKEELSVLKCKSCLKKTEKTAIRKEFICSQCSLHIIKKDETKIMVCPKCNIIMEKHESEIKGCKNCGSKEAPEHFFDPLSLVDVDTILISSRHMFRAPYSMHEKSHLASVPLPLGKVLTFEKDMALPEKTFPESLPLFLDTSNVKPNEAERLMTAAFDFGKEGLQYTTLHKEELQKQKNTKAFQDITTAIPIELFPPCILKILEGLEDGKKRSMFILTNFLTSVGWTHENAEAILLEWNRKNKEPIREGLITGQIRYHKQKNKKILPPNCRQYYQDFQVCMPDSLCDKIKNPVQYAKRKAFSLNKTVPKRATLTDEQKEMRKKFRENLKKAKANKEDLASKKE